MIVSFILMIYDYHSMLLELALIWIRNQRAYQIL
jgi:hypothetical protein